ARRGDAAAALARLLVVLAQEAREHRLRVAHAPVAAHRVQVSRRRKRERAFELRIELRLSRPDGVELLSAGPLERAEEVHLVVHDRAADAAAELIAAIVGLDGL